jgi:hypothetical protein
LVKVISTPKDKTIMPPNLMTMACYSASACSGKPVVHCSANIAVDGESSQVQGKSCQPRQVV